MSMVLSPDGTRAAKHGRQDGRLYLDSVDATGATSPVNVFTFLPEQVAQRLLVRGLYWFEAETLLTFFGTGARTGAQIVDLLSDEPKPARLALEKSIAEQASIFLPLDPDLHVLSRAERQTRRAAGFCYIR